MLTDVLLVIGLCILGYQLHAIDRRLRALGRIQLQNQIRTVDIDRRVSKRLWELTFVLKRLEKHALGTIDFEYIRDVDEVIPFELDPTQPIEPVDHKTVLAGLD